MEMRSGTSSVPPLLVFNCIAANLELVLPFVPALDAEMEVIAFEVPGGHLFLLTRISTLAPLIGRLLAQEAQRAHMCAIYCFY